MWMLAESTNQRRLFYPGNWKHTVWDIPDFHEPINRGRLVPFP